MLAVSYITQIYPKNVAKPANMKLQVVGDSPIDFLEVMLAVMLCLVL